MIAYFIPTYVVEDLAGYYHQYFFESDSNPALQWSQLTHSDANNITIPSGVLSLSIVPDDSRPNFLQFDLDMDSGYFCLYFDSPVSYQSVNGTPISFSNSDQMGTVQALVLPHPYSNNLMLCSPFVYYRQRLCMTVLVSFIIF